MEDDNDQATGLGYLLGVCSIAAILIIWMALITFGVGRLFGQNWTMANVAFVHLLALAGLGLFGVFRFWR